MLDEDQWGEWRPQTFVATPRRIQGSQQSLTGYHSHRGEVMKSMAKAIIAVFVIACLFAPVSTQSQSLELPLQKDLFPGTHTIVYGGQSFVFQTAVLIRVDLRFTSLTMFEVTVKRHPHAPPASGASASPGGEPLFITWEDYQTLMYDGDAPSDGWTAEIDLTEGGWVEK